MIVLDQQKLVEDLVSRDCLCGNTKKPRMSFCQKCYFKLPRPMRNLLYNRIGDGYEEAWESACKELGFDIPSTHYVEMDNDDEC